MNLLQKALSWFGGGQISGRGPGSPASGTVIGGNGVWPASSGDPLLIPTFRRCVELYADLISSLPVEVHEGSEAGASFAIPDHPLIGLLNDEPGGSRSGFDFWQAVVFDFEIYQDAYVELQRVGGRVVALEPLDARAVAARRMADGSLRYQGRVEGANVDLPEADCIHLRGLGGGLYGSPTRIQHGATALNMAREIDGAGLGLFQNGMRPSGVLMIEQALNPAQRELAERGLAEKFGGRMNAGRPMVLDNNTRWQQLSVDFAAAQTMEYRSAAVEDVCRLFGVPPFLVGDTEKQTSWGSGVEQQTLGFYKFSLAPRLRRIEKAFTRKLLPRGSGQFLRFQMDDLLRPDARTRAEIAVMNTRSGLETANEARGEEGRRPLPGGDVLFSQAQNIPLAGRVNGGDDADT